MSTVQLTARDMEILAHGILCLKDPKTLKALVVDPQKLAEMLGSKSANSATTLFSNVKRKLLAASEGGTVLTPTNTPTKATAKATKVQKGDGDEDPAQDDEEELAEPVKTPKKRAGCKPKKAPDATDSPPAMNNNFTAINANEIDGPESSPSQGTKRARTESATPGASAAKKRARKPKAEQGAAAQAHASESGHGHIVKMEESADDGEDAGNNSEATTLAAQGLTEEQAMFEAHMNMPGETAPAFPFQPFNFL